MCRLRRRRVGRCCACSARAVRRLLRWRASRCGARWHMCCLRRRWLGRRCARSARAAPASTLARVTVWRRAAAAWPLLHALDAGCAGFYAGARLGLARGGTCAASGGGGLAVAALARRGLRQLLCWRASRCGARRHVCCLTGGGGFAVAALARRGLRWLLGWRASRCVAGRHMCRLRRRRLGRCCARSARAAPASTLARATVWREAARALPQGAGPLGPNRPP
jgi:hypothetical protein